MDRGGGTHPGKNRENVLFGIVNNGAVAVAASDGTKRRLHEQPLQERLSRTGRSDESEMTGRNVGREEMAPNSEPRVATETSATEHVGRVRGASQGTPSQMKLLDLLFAQTDRFCSAKCANNSRDGKGACFRHQQMCPKSKNSYFNLVKA